jgi:taurine--2-oxoglutarate transaminase
LLAEITPGDINTFMFPSGGTEANETVIRMARIMTKRHKVCFQCVRSVRQRNV